MQFYSFSRNNTKCLICCYFWSKLNFHHTYINLTLLSSYLICVYTILYKLQVYSANTLKQWKLTPTTTTNRNQSWMSYLVNVHVRLYNWSASSKKSYWYWEIKVLGQFSQLQLTTDSFSVYLYIMQNRNKFLDADSFEFCCHFLCFNLLKYTFKWFTFWFWTIATWTICPQYFLKSNQLRTLKNGSLRS